MQNSLVAFIPKLIKCRGENRAWYPLFVHVLKIMLVWLIWYTPTLFDMPPFDGTRQHFYCAACWRYTRPNVVNSIFEALGRAAQHGSEMNNRLLIQYYYTDDLWEFPYFWGEFCACANNGYQPNNGYQALFLFPPHLMSLGMSLNSLGDVGEGTCLIDKEKLVAGMVNCHSHTITAELTWQNGTFYF